MTKAENYLLQTPANIWIRFDDVPRDLHEGIIEISDSFNWKNRKIEFNDDETEFRIKII